MADKDEVDTTKEQEKTEPTKKKLSPRKNTKKRKRDKESEESSDSEEEQTLHVEEDEESEISDALKHALKHYSKLVIDVAYEIPALGILWLINRKKQFGFAKITNAEWGTIIEDEVTASGKGVALYKRPISIFREILSCKFSELVKEAPQIDTYFSD